MKFLLGVVFVLGLQVSPGAPNAEGPRAAEAARAQSTSPGSFIGARDAPADHFDLDWLEAEKDGGEDDSESAGRDRVARLGARALPSGWGNHRRGLSGPLVVDISGHSSRGPPARS